jgi:hypothetical protein
VGVSSSAVSGEDFGVPAARTAAPAAEVETNIFPEFIHQYLREYIALADQKAAFAFAAVTATLAYLASQNAFQLIGLGPSAPVWSWRAFTGLPAAAALVASACSAIAVVAPRLKRNDRVSPGTIFWEDIVSYANSREYSSAVESLTKLQAAEQVRLHCFTLAQICSRKYRILNRSIWIGVGGFGLTLLFAVLK